MGTVRKELAADLRDLPLEERQRRIRAILDRVRRRGEASTSPPRSAAEVVRVIKGQREEIWKGQVAARP